MNIRNENKKVLCVGGNIESEVILRALIKIQADVVGVVTVGDKLRPTVSDYTDLGELLSDSGIKCIVTDDINSEETEVEIAKLAPDYIFVLGWSSLLSKNIIRIAKSFVVGSHPTPLPSRRGRAPIPWTILEGHNKSAVSLFIMDEGVDSGQVISQTWFDIKPLSSAYDVYMSASNALAEAFCLLYQKLPFIEDTFLNSPAEISYRGKRTPEDGILDFRFKPLDVISLVKAAGFPYPGAYFYYKDKQVIVWEADEYEGVERVGVPGQIMAFSGDGVVVAVNEGCVVLKKLTYEGRPFPKSDFIVGSVLNYRIQDEINSLRLRLSTLERKLGESI